MKLRLFSYIGLILGLLPTLVGAATWTIDPDHSNAQFKVEHMMISQVRGNFPDVRGTVLIDDADLSRSKIDVTIDTNSIDTNVAKRDAHLRSADFFDEANFPVMTFQSTIIKNNGDGTLQVKGDLSLHGVTREVELRVTGLSAPIADPWGNQRRGAQATATINRKDFGLTWNKTLETGGVLVGETVDIFIEIELIAGKS